MKAGKRELDRIARFILLSNRLKLIQRAGWVREGVKDPEHVGDHCFGVALTSYLMARHLGLDADRCALMGLIHNINESVSGDVEKRPKEATQTLSRAISDGDLKKLEYKDLTKALSALDRKTAAEFRKLWVDVEERKSREGQLVDDASKLDYVMLLSHYSDQLSDRALRDEFLKKAGMEIKTPEMRYIYDKVRKSIYKSRHLK